MSTSKVASGSDPSKTDDPGIMRDARQTAEIAVNGWWRANFDLDRTKWNVLSGSGKFYEKLGRHFVSDLIIVDLKIVAR